jgi:hypothetical protein
MAFSDICGKCHWCGMYLHKDRMAEDCPRADCLLKKPEQRANTIPRFEHLSDSQLAVHAGGDGNEWAIGELLRRLSCATAEVARLKSDNEWLKNQLEEPRQ